MSYRSNQNQYLSSRPLRQLSLKQFTFSSKHERSNSHTESELEVYKTEIHNLRLRCAKIDQIEKYANILVQTVENNKIKTQEMQRQNLEQSHLIEQLKGQLRRMQEKVESKEESLRLGSLREMEKKKVEIQQTFNAIKWQQELLNERQNKDKILATMDQKYKEELTRLKQIMKGAEVKMQQELSVWKKEGELTSKENAILRNSVEELQHSLKIKEEELNQETQKHIANCHSLQSELKHRDQLIAQIQHDSLKTIDSLDKEVDKLKVEREMLANEKCNLDRLNEHLKLEGASLIAESQTLKQHILELQEIRYANTRMIETLQIQMAQLQQSHSVIQANLIETETNYKQLSAVLQKDNVQLRKANQNMSLEMATKQKQIQDLILIVSSMENTAKSAQHAVLQQQQINARLNLRVRQLQQVLERQTAEISHLRSKNNEAERYAGETQQNYIEVKAKLVELELAYQNQKNMIQEYDQLISDESQKFKMTQAQNQSLTKEIAQLQRQLFERKEGLTRIQAKYGNQIQELQQNQIRIKQLEKMVGELQAILLELKNQQQVERARFEQERRSGAQQALEKMQKLVSSKYQQILRQKNDHFKSKIAYLQSQIALLRKEEAEPEEIPQ